MGKVQLAKSYLHAGYSIIPLAGEGQPLFQWDEFQARKPFDTEVERFFEKDEAEGIGLVCGKVSDNLEVLVFVDEATYQAWYTTLPLLLQNRLTVIATPDGGRQVYCRLAPEEDAAVAKSRLLAHTENGHARVELCGEGDYIPCAAEHEGSTVLQGDLLDLQPVSKLEHEILMEKIAALDARRPEPVPEYPDPEFPELAQPVTEDMKGGLVTFDDPGAMPAILLKVPGLITEFVDYMLDQAINPNLTMAITSGIATVSHLIGRLYKSFKGLFANLYIVNIAGPGTGKDFPRQIIKKIAMAADFPESMIENIASGQGLEDKLADVPHQLANLDEVAHAIGTLKEGDAIAQMKEDMLLTLFGASQTYFEKRTRANAKADEKHDRKKDIINHPYFGIYGSAVPVLFYKAFTTNALTNGLIARFMVVEAGPDSENDDQDEKPIPEHLAQVAKSCLQHSAAVIQGAEPLDPKVMEITPDARAFLNVQKTMQKAMTNRYNALGSAFGAAIWGRYREKAIKLAMVYAFSRDPEHPVMDLASVKWGCLFVAYTIRRTAFMCQKYVADSPFMEKVNLVVGILMDLGGKKAWVKHSLVLKKSKLKTKEIEEVVGWLVQTGDLETQGSIESRNYRYLLRQNAQFF